MITILTRSLVVVLAVALMAACGKLPDERLMDRAGTFEEEGKFTEAIASYVKLAETYPESPFRAEALYKAGLVYANGLLQIEDGVATLQQVIEQYPESKEAPQCQFMIGFIYANYASEFEKAQAAYQTFLEKYENHELVPSVEWELRNLGKDINEIPELQHLESDSQGSGG